MKPLFRTSLLALFAAIALPLGAAPALLGHKSLAGQTLDSESAKAVLMGKKVALGDTRVIIVIAKAGAAQDAFLQARVGMNTSQFQNHWRRLFMTGGGSAPKVVETEDDAAKLLAETPGAIAVVDSAKAGDLAVLAQ
ncbi:MAG TPA: hypothetical protein VHN79_03485 [Lacunisphaera sp.]|nr:hypothetical protein [Lacunisphaera sp.]